VEGGIPIWCGLSFPLFSCLLEIDNPEKVIPDLRTPKGAIGLIALPDDILLRT